LKTCPYIDFAKTSFCIPSFSMRIKNKTKFEKFGLTLLKIMLLLNPFERNKKRTHLIKKKHLRGKTFV